MAHRQPADSVSVAEIGNRYGLPMLRVQNVDAATIVRNLPVGGRRRFVVATGFGLLAQRFFVRVLPRQALDDPYLGESLSIQRAIAERGGPVSAPFISMDPTVLRDGIATVGGSRALVLLTQFVDGRAPGSEPENWLPNEATVLMRSLADVHNLGLASSRNDVSAVDRQITQWLQLFESMQDGGDPFVDRALSRMMPEVARALTIAKAASAEPGHRLVMSTIDPLTSAVIARGATRTDVGRAVFVDSFHNHAVVPAMQAIRVAGRLSGTDSRRLNELLRGYIGHDGDISHALREIYPMEALRWTQSVLDLFEFHRIGRLDQDRLGRQLSLAWRAGRRVLEGRLVSATSNSMSALIDQFEPDLASQLAEPPSLREHSYPRLAIERVNLDSLPAEFGERVNAAFREKPLVSRMRRSVARTLGVSDERQLQRAMTRDLSLGRRDPALVDAENRLEELVARGLDDRSVRQLRIAFKYFLIGPIAPRRLSEIDPDHLPDNPTGRIGASSRLTFVEFLMDYARLHPGMLPKFDAVLQTRPSQGRVHPRDWLRAGEAYRRAYEYIESLDMSLASKRDRIRGINYVLGGQRAPWRLEDVRLYHLDRIPSELSMAFTYRSATRSVLVDSGLFPNLESDLPPELIAYDGRPVPYTSPALLEATQDLVALYFNGTDWRRVNEMRMAIEHFLGGPDAPRSLSELDPLHLPPRTDKVIDEKLRIRYTLAFHDYLTALAMRRPGVVPHVVTWLEDGAPSPYRTDISPRFVNNPALVRALAFVEAHNLDQRSQRIYALRAVLGGDGAPWDLSDIRLPRHLGRIPHLAQRTEDTLVRLAEDTLERMAESEEHAVEMVRLHSGVQPRGVVRDDREVPYRRSDDRVRRHLHLTVRSSALLYLERVVNDMDLSRAERRAYLVAVRLALRRDGAAWGLADVRMADVEIALGLHEPNRRSPMMSYYRRVEEVLQRIADVFPERMQNLYSEDPPEHVIVRGSRVRYEDSHPPDRERTYAHERMTPAMTAARAVINDMDISSSARSGYTKAIDRVLTGEYAPWDVRDIRQFHLRRIEETGLSPSVQREFTTRASRVLEFMRKRYGDEMSLFLTEGPPGRIVVHGRPFPTEGPEENGRGRLNPPDGRGPALPGAQQFDGEFESPPSAGTLLLGLMQ